MQLRFDPLSICFAIVISTCVFTIDAGADDTETEFFEKKIRPVLVQHCYKCHSAAAVEIKGELRVDSRDAIRSGGESGPAVVPRKVDQSLLIEALQYESFEMPPGKKLSAEIIADFVKWIEMGAPDPRDKPPSEEAAAEISRKAIFQQRSQWWSLQPLAKALPPVLEKNDWSQRPIDRFILAKLYKANLQPAVEADAFALARRLSFVLTGLPLTPKRVREFVAGFAKDREAAIVALVDNLLESPHFGERFARHWMDVVRYTDTYGYEWDNPARGSWEYRDYLIRAFNTDVGFDQLVREQIAGDLLPRQRIDRKSGLNESLIGPMFYHLGEHRHGDSLDFNGIHQEMINNKIDAFSKTFLAYTVACARCHDHKLDAITQRDYYALAGVFMSPRWTARVIDAPGKNDAAIKELKQLRGEIGRTIEPMWKKQAGAFADEISEAMSITEKKDAELKDTSHIAQLALWRKAFGVEADKEKKDANPPLEEVAYPVARLLSLADDGKVTAVWKELAAHWKAESESRKSQNANRFTVLTDFSQPGLPTGWTMEGDGMKYGYVVDGTPLIALEGDAVLQRVLPRGYHTAALSSKLPGSIRMPAQQDIPKKVVSVELAGGEWSGFLRVPDNAFQTENVTFLDRPQPQWQAFADGVLKNGVQRITVEIATSDLNPGFPPRTGKARSGSKTLPPQDTGFHKRSWFSATGIVAHDAGGAPVDELARFARLYAGAEPIDKVEAWRRIGVWLAESVTNWCQGKADVEDVRLVNWLLSHKLLTNTVVANPSLAKLRARYRAVEQSLPFPRTANSMDERDVVAVNYPLNIRGNVDRIGPQVKRDFLQVFSGRHKVSDSKGSGRLELAQFLVNPQNPLTSRVYVNRVWLWIYGNGIIVTPNDFGHLGAQPTHPEMLDYLAREFMADGWSTKRLIRRMVLSQTFRQSGTVARQAAEHDPDNRLWHHYPTRRLEAEAIRDSLLAVSGRLDRRLFGPSIDPPRAKEDAAKRLFSGPVDGGGRRSIYVKMSIMDPPRFLVGFNLPDLKLPTGKRDVTNVPSQALILLNDPFVVGQAKYWAEQLIKDQNASIQQRVGRMFMQAFGREPDEKERLRWTALARYFGDNKSNGNLMTNQTVWQQVAHALFNTKEFIYYR